MSRPRVTWLVPEPRFAKICRILGYQPWHPRVSMASVWIRGFQLAPYLREMGFTIHCNRLNPLPDIAIFLRCYSAADVLLAKELKNRGVKIIVDTIVNYFDLREDTKIGQANPDRVKNFRRLIALADQIWTVSPFLQQKASQYHPAAYFVSDSVDPRHFHPTTPGRQSNLRRPLRLGWSGTSEKADSLEYIAPLLSPYLQAGRIEFITIANRHVKLNIPHTYKHWRYARFPAQIHSCGLCIAPRKVTDDYNRGHSIFKIGVFMAMGVPALAGPVPSYDLLLADGQAGVICHTIEDWRVQLPRFIEDREWRHRAGLAAIEKMRPYLTPVIARQISDLLQALYNGGPTLNTV